MGMEERALWGNEIQTLELEKEATGFLNMFEDILKTSKTFLQF